MSHRLPGQEEKRGTYMEVPTIEWLIENRLVPGQTEAETSLVWNTILHHVFKATDGYCTGPEMSFGDGKADLFTAHLVFNYRHENVKFLVVECKAPGHERRSEVWLAASMQLKRYLDGIRHGHRRYGVIAIGRVVRFYQWDKNNLADFQGDGSIYWLDRQCQAVTRKLEYIRDNHLGN